MELYMMNRQHGRMILEFVENGPLLWPTIEENGVTRPKKYSELSAMEAIQADCDVKATNIILQGFPPEVYALLSNHKVSKELWERIQLLMQGTSLTKQERKCKLYDEFDKFAYKKGESLRKFYLRLSLLLNDMNIYNMKLEQFQVNIKFLNTLPPEWSKFVIDVKLVRDLHTTKVDQLHAYLGQHKFHANEKGDDLIDAINHMMSFLTAVVTSRYPPTNNQLRNSSNPRQQATINNGRVTVQPIQGRQKNLAASTSKPYTSGPSGNNSGKQRTVVCYNYKGEGHMLKQCTKPKRKRDEAWFKDKVLLIAFMANLSHYGSDNLVGVHNLDNMTNNVINQAVQAMSISEQSNIMNQSETEITSDSNIIPYSQYFEPKLYDGSVIQKTKAIVIQDSEETLMLEEESLFKMVQKQKDPMMFKKKVNTKPVDYAALNQLSQDFETRPTQVEVPNELPKVSMVNSSLKKLKYHLARFDVAVKQHRVESNRFQDKIKEVLNENEQLLEQAISKDIVNIVVTANVNNAYEPVNECERCVTLETELQKDFIKNECYDKLFKQYTTLEKYCISLESQEKDIIIKKLKERIKSLSGNLKEEKIKHELEEIETINIELDHRVTKLVTKNDHLKQTYKQLYDSIKSSHIRSKEQCDDLIKQFNIKSAENSDLNASLQEKVLVITALKDTLRKLKGKDVVDEAVALHPINPELLKINVAPLDLACV
uniref:Integrase, catalytic region, zinc finger, CCHC-type, peptidase aspartic, catalytic n=1 Tax=Tanacetum cinerariifolium TaxID=118510 RepID=A0A699H7N7_TANCI|nr:hypothetical protein [Tanacetum cinerariifolium]